MTMLSRCDLSCEHMMMPHAEASSAVVVMKPAGMKARAARAARITGMTQ
jgi:hypothetical protein